MTSGALEPPSLSPRPIPQEQAQPHIVSLVLQSKKALQQGEQLCSRAHALSNASGRAALDVLALDAKVRWISDAVVEQLKLAASVARSIEEKRASLGKQVKTWDSSRTKHVDALETILESLGTQVVPPEFHLASMDSSLFGSQHTDDERGKGESADETNPRSPALRSALSSSPSATLRQVVSLRTGNAPTKDSRKTHDAPKQDRKRWKTLRDFVDDQAIEEVVEIMDQDRAALDNILARTDDYPETVSRIVTSIKASIPESSKAHKSPLEQVQEALMAQDNLVTSMASHLESLAAHYGQMATILHDSEAGETLSDDDLQDMKRDTDELPLIMAELEDNAVSVVSCHESLVALQNASQEALTQLGGLLDNLDDLGELMDHMLLTQESVEAQSGEELNGLQRHLLTLDHLHDRYIAYQHAYNKLVLEIARRSHYREAMVNMVKVMSSQLDAMAEEENEVRARFNAEYGAHLPEDICLCIGNAPTKWEISPCAGELRELLPHIDADLIVEARDRVQVAATDGVAIGTESL